MYSGVAKSSLYRQPWLVNIRTHYSVNTAYRLDQSLSWFPDKKENIVFKDGIGVKGFRFKLHGNHHSNHGNYHCNHGNHHGLVSRD